MDKYAAYIKERKGAELFEDTNGFFTYRIDGKYFYIDEIFVLSNKRKQGIGKKYSGIIENLAKENKCDLLICTICTNANNYIDSFGFIKRMGYKSFKSENTLVYLIKEI